MAARRFKHCSKPAAFDQAVTAFSYNALVDLPENQAFNEKVTERFGDQAELQSYEGYEATYIIAQAIEKAGSTDSNAIRDAIAATSYDSIMGGVIEFDEYNQAHNYAVISIVDGTEEKVVDVFPTN